MSGDRTETARHAARELAPSVSQQAVLYQVLDAAALGSGSAGHPHPGSAGHPQPGPARYPLIGVRAVVLGRGEAHGARRRQEKGRWQVDVTLCDSQVSREHARLERSGSRWTLRDLGSRNGTWLDGQRLGDEAAAIGDGSVLQLGRITLLFRQVGLSADEQGFVALRDVAGPEPQLDTLSPALARAIARGVRVLEGGAALLLRGPTGSGKEVVARALHRRLAAGGRRGDFVAVNCGALPATLVEAELFGVRKGAYSGAGESRIGLVRAAHGGTLFLDEVGDLALVSQAALLRVLQEREVRAVGETAPQPVDIAVISATNRDVDQLMDGERFRADLYARIAGHELYLPPLSERREDIGWLTARILGSLGSAATLSREAAWLLMRHGWPLNIRELEAALRHAAALADGGVIEAAHLPSRVVEAAAPRGDVDGASGRPPRDVRTRARLDELMRLHRGNLAAVARDMGKHRRQIHRWLLRFGMDADAYRDD